MMQCITKFPWKKKIWIPWANCRNCETSNGTLTIETGAPQGSILGPFFPVYTNDLPNQIKRSRISHSRFAEDTTRVSAGKKSMLLIKN